MIEVPSKLWFDDIRLPPDDGWAWARTIGEAKNLINTSRRFDEASLDHDLGLHDYDPFEQDADLRRVPRRYKHGRCGHIQFESGLNIPPMVCQKCEMATQGAEWSMVQEPDGVEFVRWLRNDCPLEKVPPRIKLHSMNPVGAANMAKELLGFPPITDLTIFPYQRY